MRNNHLMHETQVPKCCLREPNGIMFRPNTSVANNCMTFVEWPMTSHVANDVTNNVANGSAMMYETSHETSWVKGKRQSTEWMYTALVSSITCVLPHLIWQIPKAFTRVESINSDHLISLSDIDLCLSSSPGYSSFSQRVPKQTSWGYSSIVTTLRIRGRPHTSISHSYWRIKTMRSPSLKVEGILSITTFVHIEVHGKLVRKCYENTMHVKLSNKHFSQTLFKVSLRLCEATTVATRYLSLCLVQQQAKSFRIKSWIGVTLSSCHSPLSRTLWKASL